MADPLKKEPKIRDIYNPDDVEKEKISFVYDRKIQMETSEDRQKAMANANRWEKNYENLRDTYEKAGDEWQSNHVVPVTIAAVETAKSEISEQQIRPIISARGAEDECKSRVFRRIFDYAWEVSDSDSLVDDAVHDDLVQGTAITQEYFLKNTVKISGKKDEDTTEAVDYEDVMGELVKLQDFYVDEFARGFTGPFAARDCIRRYIMNYDDFRQFFKGEVWDEFNNAQYVRPGGTDTNYYEWFKPPVGVDPSKQVEVLWYWAKSPQDRLRIVANDVLIKDGGNPYKHKQLPFVRWVCIKRPHRFYGKGIPELLESVQDEQNTLRRMIIDRNHLDIDKMFFVSNRLGLSEDDVIARPHGMIPVDDINGAKSVEYGDIPRSVELSLKHLEDDATISTGINPRAQAMPTAGTATEAAILKESTLKRLRRIVYLMKKESLTRLARLRSANIIQFYPQVKMEKIVGEAGTEQYEAEKTRLQATGQYVEQDGKGYSASYRTIPLQNEELDIDEEGQPQIKSASTSGFFPAKPEYYMPLARGGFDIKYDAGATLQISKPLQQQKDLEWADRMLMIAQLVPQAYDIVKIGDEITRSYDKDPNSLKTDQSVVSGQDKQLEMTVKLAGMENQMMIKGQEVPPTPNSSPPHTMVHLSYMESEEFQKNPDQEVTRIFTEHVTGELMAQQGRADMQGGQPAAPGGETTPTSASQGMQNRPGGMAQPSTQNPLAAKNTGQAQV